MVDEVTTKNGPLEVWPATHKGEIHSLWQEGRFTGAVSDEITEQALANRKICTGKAGSVCLMHTRLLHGSAPNKSAAPRTLYICVYAAADAVAFTPSPVPTNDKGWSCVGKTMGALEPLIMISPCQNCPKGPHFLINRKQLKKGGIQQMMDVLTGLIRDIGQADTPHYIVG